MARSLVAPRLGRTLAALWLTQRATVYTPDPTTGTVSVVAQADLPCRLVSVGAAFAQSGDDRASLLGRYTLYWDPTVAMPAERVQVAIDGTRWELERGTEGQSPDLGGTGSPVLYAKCDVVEVRG